ncbi:MAG TPA: ATP-binding protein, partial [Fimbriimonas sp.]|nr:ATP-binding protein [Fimbriimonas sp.]
AIGGYRSFGKTIQRFGHLAQINLFIGQNNCGKSNILRFLHDVYPKLPTTPQYHNRNSIELSDMDRHMPHGATFIAGTAISLQQENGPSTELGELYLSMLADDHRKNSHLHSIFATFKCKARLDDSKDLVWFDFGKDRSLLTDNWKQAFDEIKDHELQSLWNSLTRNGGGNRNQHWFPETLQRLTRAFNSISVKMIPAIRQVGKHGSVSEEFGGEGIIERLAKLQNPDVLNQQDKKKFERINAFLRNVLDNKTATIEVPHARDTILVHMDNKSLPLESLGTGIHEVIILAAAATILENSVICMEEPELHLNPLLQKKLMRYLSSATNNQYFITTHSAALMDTPNTEIYHIRLANGESIAERATSDKKRSAICEDLGYHPSDLLQSNCVIWVEGPSDRIYINYWLQSAAPQLVEGIHYSIMFYGGRLLSHLTGDDVEKNLADFISLRRLNRRGVIVIDSDKEKKGARINATKKRLQAEFDSGPGYAWVTEGREIENYLNPENIKVAIRDSHPSATSTSAFGQFDNTLKITTKSQKASQASKVDVAKYVTNNFTVDFGRLDLKKQIQSLVSFIKASNVGIEVI